MPVVGSASNRNIAYLGRLYNGTDPPVVAASRVQQLDVPALAERRKNG